MLRFVWVAPAIAVGYAVIAYGFVTVGCMPPFADVDFFGVAVTVFLLLALTVAALILIVLALLNALRALRTAHERPLGQALLPRRGWIAAAAVFLAVAAFAGVAWLGVMLFQMPCAA